MNCRLAYPSECAPYESLYFFFWNVWWMSRCENVQCVGDTGASFLSMLMTVQKWFYWTINHSRQEVQRQIAISRYCPFKQELRRPVPYGLSRLTNVHNCNVNLKLSLVTQGTWWNTTNIYYPHVYSIYLLTAQMYLVLRGKMTNYCNNCLSISSLHYTVCRLSLVGCWRNKELVS